MCRDTAPCTYPSCFNLRQGYTLPGLTKNCYCFLQASRNYSIHPLGVFYNKANEGAQYQDGTTGNDTADNAIMPNETYLYKWIVPDAVAPTENDPSCLTWMYHSNVHSTKDTHSGKVTISLVAMLKCELLVIVPVDPFCKLKLN